MKKEIKRRLKQCCSCEKTFTVLKDRECPYCGSGNWVFGYIDDPEPIKRREYEK